MKFKVQIWNKTDGHCWYCGVRLDPSWHIEHQTPLSQGGEDQLYNMVGACARCNNSKSNRDVEEFRSYLSLNWLAKGLSKYFPCVTSLNTLFGIAFALDVLLETDTKRRLLELKDNLRFAYEPEKEGTDDFNWEWFDGQVIGIEMLFYVDENGMPCRYKPGMLRVGVDDKLDFM